MVLAPASPRITKPGPNGDVVLSARVWALVAEVEKRAGLKPGTIVVTQGSFRPRTTYSGTVHTGGGTLDIRTWNIGHDAALRVVAAFRGFDDPAWYRDKDHGGFDPHIHVVVADEPGLSASAQWQVIDYRAGYNGLSGSSHGPDYHPRPEKVETFHYQALPNPVVYLAALQWGVPSRSSKIVQNALCAEGFLPAESVRYIWFKAANLALRQYRNAHGYADNGAAIRALGADHGFTVR